MYSVLRPLFVRAAPLAHGLPTVDVWCPFCGWATRKFEHARGVSGARCENDLCRARFGERHAVRDFNV